MEEEKAEVTVTLTTRDRTKSVKSNDIMSDDSSENGSAYIQMDYIDRDANLQKPFQLNVNLKSPTQDPNFNITQRFDFYSDIECLSVRSENR